MRITFLLAILTSFSLFFSACDLALAQDMASPSANIITDPGAVEIGESLISPKSPLYFLKTLREKIELMFVSTPQAKVNRQLEFSGRRLREVKALVKDQKQDLIPPTLEKYSFFIDQAVMFAGDDEQLNSKITEELSRHLDVLQRVYDNVGNPRAKQAIMTALIKSEEQIRKILERSNLASQQQQIKKVFVRDAYLCQFLAREATSSSLNDTERDYLKSKVGSCQQHVNTLLKDELMDYFKN